MTDSDLKSAGSPPIQNRRLLRGLFAWLLAVLFVNDLVTQLLGPGLLATLFGAQKDVLLLLLVVTTTLVIATGRWRPGRPMMLAGVLVGIGVAIGATRADSLVEAAYGFRNTYFGLLLLVCVPALLSLPDVRWLLRLFLCLAQGAAIVAIVTWLVGMPWLVEVATRNADTISTSYFVSGSVRPRAFSPFVSANDLGAVMAAALLVTLILWERLGAIPPTVQFALPTTALLLSQSRTALLGLAAGALLVLGMSVRTIHRPWHPRFSNRAAPALVLVVVASVSLGARILTSPSVPTGSWMRNGVEHVEFGEWRQHVVSRTLAEPSARGHVGSISDGLQLLAREPLGVGLGTVGPRASRYVDEPTYVESSPLLIGLTAGIQGLVGYMLLMAATVASSTRLFGHPTRPLHLTSIILAASAPTQLFLPAVQDIPVAWTWWFLIAAGLVDVRSRACPRVTPSPLVPRSRTRAGRLVIVHPSDELYGIDRVLLSVVDALRAQADVEVWIPTDISYPKRPLSNELIKRGVTARGLDLPVLRRPHLTPTGTWYTLRRIRLSIQLVRRDRPSLMWVNGTAMTPLLVTAWVTRTPAVLHVHEILEPHERCLLAPLLRTANTVIAVSEATRRALPKSVRSRAVVVPNAVSGPTVPPKLRTAGPVRVLFAGRWTPRKGVAELIFAWRSVKRTDLVLTILGGPPPPPAVGIDVVTLARGTRGVTIVGEVRDVRPYLTECDVVVVPSTLPESSGLVVAEAASMARPAIASAMGGLTELVRDGVTGWLVPAGDASALANVLARLDRTELHRRGRAARKEWEERWPQHTFSDLLRGLPTSLVPPRKSTRVSAKVRIDDSVSG